MDVCILFLYIFFLCTIPGYTSDERKYELYLIYKQIALFFTIPLIFPTHEKVHKMAFLI